VAIQAASRSGTAVCSVPAEVLGLNPEVVYSQGFAGC
jgi:hypothetical protein